MGNRQSERAAGGKDDALLLCGCSCGHRDPSPPLQRLRRGRVSGRVVAASEITTTPSRDPVRDRHGSVTPPASISPLRGLPRLLPAPGQHRGQTDGGMGRAGCLVPGEPGSNGPSSSRLPGRGLFRGLPAPTPTGQLADGSWPRASPPHACGQLLEPRQTHSHRRAPRHSWLLFPMTRVREGPSCSGGAEGGLSGSEFRDGGSCQRGGEPCGSPAS